LWVRRVVLAPLVVLIAFVWLPMAVWLVVIIAGVVAWALPGRLRILRVIFMVGLYLLWDAGALVALFALWVASGFGIWIKRAPFQRAHYRLAGAMLGSLFWAARWLLRLTIVVDDSEGDLNPHQRPLIVASRHAGPADSFIIVHTLLNSYGREPAIVLKATLQWDPAVDVLLNRIPTRFVAPGRAKRPGQPGGAQAIGELASGLDGDDALLIFPEGGNVTARRRTRRIDQLRQAGHEEFASRAESMTHVMAPHSGGLLTAIGSAPDAEIVMLAHAGIDKLETVGDIWRELPVDKTITLKSWTAGPAPAEGADEWLFAWWERVDAWVGANQAPVRGRQEKSAETDSPE
jgi:1-acyl-sn-glycerol-3-phosphate acyltransferase